MIEIRTIGIDQLARSPELKDKRLTVQVSKRFSSLHAPEETAAR